MNDLRYFIISEAQELRYTSVLEFGVNMLRNVITISLFMISTAYAEKPDWAESEFYCEYIPNENKEFYGSYCPIVYVDPSWQYTRNRIEGSVVVKMTITKFGSVTDTEIFESTHRGFERPAIRAAEKLKFRPYVVNEEITEISNYYFKFYFTYE